MKHLLTTLGRVAIAAIAASFVACSDLMPIFPEAASAPAPAPAPAPTPVRQYRTADVEVRVSVPALTPARTAHRAAPAAVAAPAVAPAARMVLAPGGQPPSYTALGSHADVTAVTITAAGNDAAGQPQNPLATVELTESAGAWTGTLTGITLDTPITFTAVAKNSSDTVLFRGSHTATITRATAALTINLTAEGSAAAGQFPVVSAITTQQVRAGGSATVTVSVTGKKAETLSYRFSNGAFAPSSGTVTTTSPQEGATGAATITSTYTASAAKGRYTAQVTVTNAAGNRVAVDFRIPVEAPAGLSASLGPAVLSIAGRRTPAGVLWTAVVSSAGDGSGVTYAWKFESSSDNAVAGTSFTDSTVNPAVLTGYDQTKTGTLSVEATEGGLKSTATFTVPANLFPDSLQLPAADLLINEIDYDQPGSSDNAEFVEILNPGSNPVDLTAYRIEMVDGSGKEAYASYVGTGSLAAGGYLVIGDSAVLDAATLPGATVEIALGSGSLQQGPDAVRIIRIADEKVMDAVQYEGTPTGIGEGASAPTDPSTADKSIGRCPNGSDSNDNGADFRTMTATPGKTNTCT